MVIAKLHWILLSVGLGLIVVAVGGTAMSLDEQAKSKNAALQMPSIDSAQSQGRFDEVRSDKFAIIQPAGYEFSPSPNIRELAGWHVILNGFVPRTWYQLIPASQSDLPLVILLHGAGRDGLSLIEMWKDVSEQHGVALLAPNSFGSTWPLETPDPGFINGLVEEMVTRYDIDEERIYLFGHSDGAAYAQILLNRAKGPWRAAALHAGYVPLEFLQTPETPKPFRLYIGDREHISSIPGARTVGTELALWGHDNELVIIPGHTHWVYDAGPQIAEDTWAWLVEISRS